MSLVEKTLRKLQESGRTASGPSAEAAQRPTARPEGEGLRTPQVHAHGPMVPIERGTLRAAGLLAPQEDLQVLVRQYRKIKQPLIARAIGRGAPRAPKGYLIMIASAMSGEGKTFTAVNLALSMALEKDLRVLLVDADVAKPQLSHVLGRGDASGLLDALRDPALDASPLS